MAGQRSLQKLIKRPGTISCEINNTRQRDKDHHTHPATVQHWDNWEADVKNKLQEVDMMVSSVSAFHFVGQQYQGNCQVHKLLSVLSRSRMRVLHDPVRLLQALMAEGIRYNIIGRYNYAYQINQAVANYALYWKPSGGMLAFG